MVGKAKSDAGHLRGRALLLCCLLGLGALAGCFGADDSPGKDLVQANPLAGVLLDPRAGYDTCDSPLLAEGDRTRSSEVMVATNPLDHDELAAVFKVAYPVGEQQSVMDAPMWDALARSTDGGRTWRYQILHGYPGDPEVHAASAVLYGSAFLSDPVVAFADDGTLVFAGLAAKAESIELFSATFLPGQMEPASVSSVNRGDLRSIHGLEDLPPILDQVPTPIAFIFNDGPHIGADPAGPGVWLSWGVETVLDPEAAGSEGSRTTPAISVSNDGGRTWSPMVFTAEDGRLGDVEGTNWGASRPLVDAEGRVHMFNRERSSKTIWDWVSEDDGQTWSERVPVVAGLENSGGSGGYWRNTNPDPGVDRSGGPDHGSIYVTWSDTRNGDRDVFVVASRDGGKTWSEPLRVHSDPVGNGKDQFYPYLTVEPRNGAVDVMFMDRRNDTADETWSVAYLARSTDGGRSFVDMPLGSEPTNPDWVTNGQTEDSASTALASYGDYHGITYTSDGVLPVWQDGRASTATQGYSDIFQCRILTEDLA
ncbi:MAG TPA: sialidase family protein [Candidatus Thermoplasmatota archaeon]|nr:sialidase family protein [Candidatus Thermoplasmatota archaeon]